MHIHSRRHQIARSEDFLRNFYTVEIQCERHVHEICAMNINNNKNNNDDNNDKNSWTT